MNHNNGDNMKISYVLIFILLSNLGFSDDDAILEKYKKGKELCVEQQWQAAISLFDEIIEDFPKSMYHDDALFWKGYCQEKIPSLLTDAFNSFEVIKNNYPGSSWIDDAIIHQINIAEEMLKAGKESYRNFLKECLSHAMPEIKHRAAISLGKNGDKSVIPILKELSNDKNLGKMANRVLKSFEMAENRMYSESNVPENETDVRILYDKSIVEKREKESGKFLWFETRRYAQYRSMLQKEDNWSMEELRDFALWHILDTDKFEELQSYSDPYDKKEWLRKYWILQDPTPTTEMNEKKAEFERRVIYAKAHFSDFDKSKQFNYLKDQYLKYEWEHAPWDARGEIYIKYGEPDARSIDAWRLEEWVYFRYNVDFYINQYVTNIYGNAIKAGPMSQDFYNTDNIWEYPGPENNLGFNFNPRHQVWNTYVDQNFIYKNQFLYEHDYQADAIDGFEFELDEKSNTVNITYSFPKEELEAFLIDGKKYFQFTERYRVLDEDLREISVKESEHKIKDNPDSDKLASEIRLHLPAGKYLFSLKIDDKKSDKLAIYLTDIVVDK